jgi:hypothetical protein
MENIANLSAYGGLAKGRSPKDEFVRKAKVRPKGESPSFGGYSASG